jgi:3-polyprenyl-4-hydroxybenzoate decarboxylase and related decarboxylases
MGLPREVTVYSEVSKVAECVDVRLTPGGGCWLHGVVKIRKKQEDDGLKAIEAAFRGHGSLKHVVIVDEDIDIDDPSQIEWAIATRFQAKHGLVVIDDAVGSSLDPSADRMTRKTSKMGLDATIPHDKPKEIFRRWGYQEVKRDSYD